MGCDHTSLKHFLITGIKEGVRGVYFLVNPTFEVVRLGPPDTKIRVQLTKLRL